MKKIALFLAAAALVVSCKKLADNEYEITGEVDSSLEGKSVVLEKQGGFMGAIPVDTVKVEGGKFIFKDTTSAPSIYFISFEGKNEKLNFILEPGEIEIKVDKDTLYKSVTGGTYNNEKLEEFKQLTYSVFQKNQKFQKANTDKLKQAMQSKDTVTANKLRDEYKKLAEKSSKDYEEFIKKNPKAYPNLLVLGEIARIGIKDNNQLKAIFNSLDPELKKSKEGKQIGDYFAKMDAEQNAPQQPQAETQTTAGVNVGDIAPNFSAATPDGKTLSLKQSLGKVTIIDFWASWCKPCRMENPNVVALYKELHGKGLNIIGVSLDKEAGAWKKAIADDKLTWSHVSNLKYWDDVIAKQYGVQGIPATFILDANGKVVAKDLRGDELKAKVSELLATAK